MTIWRAIDPSSPPNSSTGVSTGIPNRAHTGQLEEPPLSYDPAKVIRR